MDLQRRRYDLHIGVCSQLNWYIGHADTNRFDAGLGGTATGLAFVDLSLHLCGGRSLRWRQSTSVVPVLVLIDPHYDQPTGHVPKGHCHCLGVVALRMMTVVDVELPLTEYPTQPARDRTGMHLGTPRIDFLDCHALPPGDLAQWIRFYSYITKTNIIWQVRYNTGYGIKARI